MDQERDLGAGLSRWRPGVAGELEEPAAAPNVCRVGLAGTRAGIMPAVWWHDYGGDRSAPTDWEREFLGRLKEQPGVPPLDVWLHEDGAGTPWMMLSLDESDAGAIRRTWRVDVDEEGVRGGVSPAYLNWDSGVRAADAEIDTTDPDAIELEGAPLDEVVAAVARWFASRRDRDDPPRRGTDNE